jgi:hypothetical protein
LPLTATAATSTASTSTPSVHFTKIWGSARAKVQSSTGSKITPKISGDDTDGYAKGAIIGCNKTTGNLTEYRSSTGNLALGTKTFDSAQTLIKGLTDTQWVGEGDFTGSGFADIAVIKTNGDFLIYQNAAVLDASGNSSFKAPVKVGGGWSVDKVFITDVDGDGKDDIVFRKPGTGDLYALGSTYTSTSGFTFSNLGLAASVDKNDSWYEAADLTGDGIPELIWRNSAGTLFAYDTTYNNGTNVAPGKIYTLGTGWNSATAIAISDVTQDGKPDFVYRDSSNNLRVLPEAGFDGTKFTWGASVIVGQGWGGSDLVA